MIEPTIRELRQQVNRSAQARMAGMTDIKKRKVYSAEFKAKVGIEAVRGVTSVTEIAQLHGVHPVMVSQWKKEILTNAGSLFECKRGPKGELSAEPGVRLYSEIGRLRSELDGLKSKTGR